MTDIDPPFFTTGDDDSDGKDESRESSEYKIYSPEIYTSALLKSGGGDSEIEVGEHDSPRFKDGSNEAHSVEADEASWCISDSDREACLIQDFGAEYQKAETAFVRFSASALVDLRKSRAGRKEVASLAEQLVQRCVAGLRELVEHPSSPRFLRQLVFGEVVSAVEEFESVVGPESLLTKAGQEVQQFLRDLEDDRFEREREFNASVTDIRLSEVGVLDPEIFLSTHSELDQSYQQAFQQLLSSRDEAEIRAACSVVRGISNPREVYVVRAFEYCLLSGLHSERVFNLIEELEAFDHRSFHQFEFLMTYPFAPLSVKQRLGAILAQHDSRRAVAWACRMLESPAADSAGEQLLACALLEDSGELGRPSFDVLVDRLEDSYREKRSVSERAALVCALAAISGEEHAETLGQIFPFVVRDGDRKTISSLLGFFERIGGPPHARLLSRTRREAKKSGCVDLLDETINLLQSENRFAAS